MTDLERARVRAEALEARAAAARWAVGETRGTLAADRAAAAAREVADRLAAAADVG